MNDNAVKNAIDANFMLVTVVMDGDLLKKVFTSRLLSSSGVR
jgi:hypothetical protein